MDVEKMVECIDKYKLSLHKEITSEIIGGIFAEFNRYIIKHPECNAEEHPVFEKAKEVWLLRESVLEAKNISELVQIKAEAKAAVEWLKCQY